jgi:hypothetical protein
MAKKWQRASDQEIAALKESMEAAELDFGNAKLAYYNRTEYKDKTVGYEDLKSFAESYITKNYALQKAAFGKIHVKIIVANLMRE